MSWEIRYTDEARWDLRDVFEYISFELLESDTAKRLVRQIMEDAGKLNHMPMRHRLYDDEPWHSQGLRFFPVKNYLVFYCPEEKTQTVYIVRIIYGGRDVRKQLSEDIDF